MNAALYYRVSTEEQVSGYGLDVQRERCRAMVTVKGWQVAGEYSDEGISGTKGPDKRPGLAALIAAVEGGDVSAVIVLALDRLGRKTRIVLDLVERFAVRGVALVSCKESLDTATPQGQFVLTMFAALAQLERDTIVERTSAGREVRGRQDGERGGRVPFGYARVEGGVEVDRPAAAVVRRIYQMRERGASLRAIAREVSEWSEPPHGSHWHGSTIRQILANEPAYRGGQRGHSPLRWPPIL